MDETLQEKGRMKHDPTATKASECDDYCLIVPKPAAAATAGTMRRLLAEGQVQKDLNAKTAGACLSTCTADILKDSCSKDTEKVKLNEADCKTAAGVYTKKKAYGNRKDCEDAKGTYTERKWVTRYWTIPNSWSKQALA